MAGLVIRGIDRPRHQEYSVCEHCGEQIRQLPGTLFIGEDEPDVEPWTTGIPGEAVDFYCHYSPHDPPYNVHQPKSLSVKEMASGLRSMLADLNR